MTWLPGHANDSAAEVLNLRPAAAERAHELEAALYVDDRIDPTIVRLVHNRVNQLLGIERIAPSPPTEMSTRERAALEFAEQYVMDPGGVTDLQAVELNALFTEPELTALTFAVAVYDAMGRVRLVLDLEPEAVAT